MKLANFLNIFLKKLPKLIFIYRYNRLVKQPITSILWIYFWVDG